MKTEIMSNKIMTYNLKTKLFLKVLNRLEFGSLDLDLLGERFHFIGRKPGAKAELVIMDERAIAAIIKKSDIGLAESLEANWISSTNFTNLIMLAIANEKVLVEFFTGTFFGKIFYKIKHLLRFNNQKNSKKNIQAHYDLGNNFYKLWLDETLTYSAAIFSGDNISLKDAQIRKYERILDQLNVKENDEVLEIGCGWGGFALHAIKTRKVKMHCITLSNEQFNHVQKLINEHQLSDFWVVELKDYRDINNKYDGVVSIEMIEAVGFKYWEEYFEVVKRSLKPQKRAVIQAITIKDEFFAEYAKGTDFIQQYIFPGGMLLSNYYLSKISNAKGFMTLDFFEFGLDYARTLQEWEKKFTQKLAQVKEIGFDERFIKIWKLYFNYCEAGFLSKRLDVCHITIQRGH